jgi:outer membrane protein assembly factor BamB
MLRLLLALAGLLVGSLVVKAWADDWPQFRGPQGSAQSRETNLPDTWNGGKNIAWKAKVPGYAWSSPIVAGDRVFVTTAVSDKQKKPSAGFGMGGFGPPGGPGGKGGFPRGKGGFPRGGFGGRMPDAVYRWEVYCLSAADGRVIWKQTASAGKPTQPTNGSNTFATETPVSDGERVYAYFGMAGVVVCYDLAGKELWKKDLGTYSMMFGHGTGASPTLADGRLFIQCDNEEKSFLVALDAMSGKELWRTPRTERTSWSTPLIWKNKVRTELVCLGSPSVRSYDPATGKQLWELGGISGQIKATPVASSEFLYVGSPGGFGGFGGGPGGGGGRFGGGKALYAVKAGASGNITLTSGAKASDGIAWKLTQAGPATASPLLYQGRLYLLEERGGLLSCHDATTGKQLYKERLPDAGGFTSSPWAYDGKIFCLDDSGTTFVVAAGPEFKMLGQNAIDERCWSSPAVSGGALFLRTVDHLYCIRSK